MIIVSACLCGINTRYDGKNSLDNRILKLLSREKAIPICPEQLGGLTTPRKPCEIKGGTGVDVLNGMARIVDAGESDFTKEFLKGAYETVDICKKCSVDSAILKTNSPSCGFGQIYNGKFDGSKIKGNGVTADLLLQSGIHVYTENDINKLI